MIMMYPVLDTGPIGRHPSLPAVHHDTIIRFTPVVVPSCCADWTTSLTSCGRKQTLQSAHLSPAAHCGSSITICAHLPAMFISWLCRPLWPDPQNNLSTTTVTYSVDAPESHRTWLFFVFPALRQPTPSQSTHTPDRRG